jgi:hypothetical protein
MTLDCAPAAAWRALTSPAAFRAVSAPFTSFTSRDLNGFPEHWPPGEHRVSVFAFGVVPIGEQLIDVSFEERGDIRIFHDDGRGLSGALTLATGWHHSMAVSPLPRGRTLYRDELRFDGPVVLWAAYWAFWQWRGVRLRRLARRWR